MSHDGLMAASYRRWTGSSRGAARREQLLDDVIDDIEANGIADFSLRRAAKAAGATHKVLLYYFDGPEDLLGEAIRRLRTRRIENALAVVAGSVGEQATLSGRVRQIWPVLADDSTGVRAVDQAVGLAMSDPERFGHLADGAVQPYVDALRMMCPADWSEARTDEVCHLIVATFRGFLVEWQTGHDAESIAAGLTALIRMLEREEAALPTHE